MRRESRQLPPGRMSRLLRRFFYMTRVRLADEYSRMSIYDRYLGFGKVGGRVRLTGLIDFGTEPALLTFGDRITIADGVRFLTHDGAAALFRDEVPDLNVHLPISVGDNVFIGSDSLILPGVAIGSNCVVGAGSVVTGDVPSGWVVAGCPARPIKSLEEYRATVFRKAGIPINGATPRPSGPRPAVGYTSRTRRCDAEIRE